MPYRTDPDPSLFVALLAPTPLSEFLRETFFKAALHVPGSAEKLQGYPGLAELSTLLESATELRAIFDEFRQARIEPGDAKDMFRVGATLCMTGVQGASDVLSRLVGSARVALQFSGRVSVRAYWSPPRGGFGPHFDARVVTTLQVSGNKRWWYTQQPIETLPLGNSDHPLTDEQRAATEAQPICSVCLAPGDVLCLPPGVVHWASAETESLSYNLAFDYMDGTVAELVADALCEELLTNTALREPLYGDFAAPQATLARLRKACIDASDALLEASARPDLLLRLWQNSVDGDDSE